MSITRITKRIACFYDDKGEYLDCKAFSKIAKTFKFKDRTYNVFHDTATYTEVSRWYWDVHLYHYQVNNPNPIILNKKVEPIIDAEMYNIQLETRLAKQLNDLAKPKFELNWKTALIGLGIVIVIILILTGTIKIK